MSNRRSIADFPRNEAGLVDEFIGSAYDTVKKVYDNLDEIKRLDVVLEEIPELAQSVVDNALSVAMPPYLAEAQASAEAAAVSAISASDASIAANASAELAEDMAKISVVRWCGNQVTAPTSRLDGSPLQISDEYGNTTDNLRYNWTGTAWVALNSSAQQLEERLVSPEGANFVGITSGHIGAQSQTLWDVVGRHLTPEMFGAIGDGNPHPLSERYATLAQAQARYPFVTSLTQQIDWAAIQAASNVGLLETSILYCAPKTYIFGDPIIWRGGMFYKGTPGVTEWKLAPESNCSIIESADINKWASFTAGQSLEGYPYDGGIDGILLDGNAGFQSVAPTSAADMQFGLNILTHRFGIGWLQIRRINGVGSLTQYNAAIMYAFRTDGVDDYGLQGSPLGSPSPYDFKQINVIDCLYEHFIFKGPADIPIWHLTTNYCGWLTNGNIPTTPRTSLMFPGEEIHSVRIESACKLSYLNANGALYGRSLYVAPFVRIQGDSLICTGSWGACKIEGSAFGNIASLMVQQNTYAWGGVYKPGLEGTYGTSSATGKSKITISHLGLRRLTTPVTLNAIGPGILDNAGMQILSIDGVDSSPVAGHGLVIGATNRGGIYPTVNFDSIQGIAHDGEESCAVRIEAGARDWRIGTLRLTNCNRGFANMGQNMRGIVRDGTVEVSDGQISLEGVVANSQVPSVIPGDGFVALDNIGSWGLEILHTTASPTPVTTRYYNRFKTTVNFSGGTVGTQALPSVPHTLWRRPDPRDFKMGIMFSGTTWPSFNVGIRTPTNNTDFTPAAFIHTAAVGNITMSIEFS